MTDILRRTLAWERQLGIRRTVVLFVTLWMTWRAFTWAAEYAAFMKGTGGLEVAAIISAVTMPITYLQKVIFEQYVRSKDVSADT